MRRADVAQLVEHHLAKVGVAGSNPVVRSNMSLVPREADVVVEQLRCEEHHRRAGQKDGR